MKKSGQQELGRAYLLDKLLYVSVTAPLAQHVPPIHPLIPISSVYLLYDLCLVQSCEAAQPCQQ